MIHMKCKALFSQKKKKALTALWAIVSECSKKILLFVCFGLIVNNQPKNENAIYNT